LIVPVWLPACPEARTQHAGQERPVRVGLDRRADADEPAALLEVRLEVRALRVVERAGHARIQEHHRAVGVQALRGELRAHIGGRGGGDRAGRAHRLRDRVDL